MKTFLVWLSALLCITATVVWLCGFTHNRSELFKQRIGHTYLTVQGFEGGLDLSFAWTQGVDEKVTPIMVSHTLFENLSRKPPSSTLAQLDFVHLGDCIRSKYFVLTLPFWLLALTFSLAPMLTLQSFLAARRDKKFFEQIQREKLGASSKSAKPK